MSKPVHLEADRGAIPELASVRAAILEWFDRHQRDLPWRATRDPYAILVSEVMLQQTQVDRVIPYYHRFLQEFPDVSALAKAPTADVIRLWAGLGYNRRAVNLQRAAVAVEERFGGVFPRSVEELRSLPGVGAYTAGAIACFAFEQDVAFLDTNMSRVVSRVFLGVTERPELTRVAEFAEQLVEVGNGWKWNQALIEFGALNCTARKPLCGLCPLQAECRAFPFAQSLVSNRVSSTKGRPEQSFAGSSRYYRGRVIDALRSTTERGVTLPELGTAVRDDFESEHLPWLYDLIEGLQRDGLARIAEAPERYDASALEETRVSLP